MVIRGDLKQHFMDFICVHAESGRLFVWGENQYGQLSAGSKEVIAKPSCVKEIKNLGYKVRNIAFGEAFSVILTGRNVKIELDCVFFALTEPQITKPPHIYSFTFISPFFVVFLSLYNYLTST